MTAEHIAPALPAIGSHLPAHQFFTGAGKLLPRDQGGLPYYLAAFRTDHFSAELFSQYAIDYPAHIQASVTKRQVEFFAGRLCARMILDAYGLERHVVATGKQREPLWPEGFVGSITHSGGYAAAIVCLSREMLGEAMVVSISGASVMGAICFLMGRKGYLRALEAEEGQTSLAR